MEEKPALNGWFGNRNMSAHDKALMMIIEHRNGSQNNPAGKKPKKLGSSRAPSKPLSSMDARSCADIGSIEVIKPDTSFPTAENEIIPSELNSEQKNFWK
ncbi:MAG: hypothetical protein ACO201_01920 [Rickettsiales bacterium]